MQRQRRKRTYDGLGRTLTVAQPNNSGTTTYLYEGNTVRVTSPSGRWKKYVMDGLGRLAQVIEPRPAGGEYTTSYTYNLNGKLTQVSMPRDGTTQTRTFTYDTVLHSRLVSSTNPENGTVSYTYNPDGTVATKTDAKNIRTEFSYDAYKRPTEMRKLTLSGGVWTEDRCQRVTYDYTWDGVVTRYLQKVSWGWNASNQPCNNTAGAFEEQYTYLTNGAIASKSLVVIRLIGGQLRSAQLQASWTYNNEGQTTGITYPARFEGSHFMNSGVNYTYDTMGRGSGVSWLSFGYQHNPPSTTIVSNVTYNSIGALTSFNHLGQTETRQYNDLGQLTRITQGTAIDIEYRFSATANDGKITSQKNWRTGEDVTYQYDQLERLISASTTAGPQSWGLSWSYDGFGNRLAQTVTQGSGPAHSVLVNASTNRISSAGFSYDPNGNLTAMPQTGGGTLNLTYDLSNRVTNLAHNGWTEDYLYSPDNRRIWRSAAQTFCGAYPNESLGITEWNPGMQVREQYILYSPAGQKLGVYCLNFSGSGQTHAWTASEENVYWGSRLVGKRIGISAMSHFITDRLHSKGDGSAFYPYGESKTGAAGDDREQFATYTRDQSSGLDYADQRWYSSRLGRFLTVDPAADGNNHYSYSSSDPVNSYDPNGLLTVIVSGTSEQNAEWSRPGSEMYGLIQEHFQETPGCVFVFDWSDSISGTAFGSAMVGAAFRLMAFVDEQYRNNPHCGGTPLNLVGYSHGGNVSLVYTHLPGSRIVENLVTLGTPSRIDIEVNSRNVVNFCAVSRSDDLVQFVGAHPLQVSEAIYGSIRSAQWSRLGVEALLRGQFQLARYYFELAAAAAAWSAAWILDTRRQPRARNFIIGGGPGMSREAHTAVRSPDAWRQVVSHPNWNCR